MKSPWKFLAQLLPQRQSAGTSESSIEHDVAGERSESEEPESSALADESQEVPTQVHVEPIDGSARRGRNRLRGDSATPQAETAETHARPPRQKTPARAKRTRAAVPMQDDVTADRDEPAQSLSPEPFLDEVAGVDQEIRQLRLRLAQKLHLQNVQLKKMLERFDRS